MVQKRQLHTWRWQAVALSEAQHQSNVIKWSQQPSIRTKWPELALLYHIPNGGRRDSVEARHLKEQGVKPGVPDLCLPVPRGAYHGAYLEMKTEKGRISEAQKWWRFHLEKQGYLCETCYGWENAVKVLEWYLSLPVGDRNG